MASFPTSGITLSQVGSAFGLTAPYLFNNLTRPPQQGSVIPSGWQVKNKAFPPDNKASTNDLDRYRGGGYEPSFPFSIKPGQGPDEGPGIYDDPSTVWGYSGFSSRLYGSVIGSTNDEGWRVIQAACVCENAGTAPNFGFILTIAVNGEKLVSSMRDNPYATLTFQVSGSGQGNGTYTSASALADASISLDGWICRQLFWNVGKRANSVYTNPWSPAGGGSGTMNLTVNRLSYER